jgi:hypothetical protein
LAKRPRTIGRGNKKPTAGQRWVAEIKQKLHFITPTAGLAHYQANRLAPENPVRAHRSSALNQVVPWGLRIHNHSATVSGRINGVNQQIENPCPMTDCISPDPRWGDQSSERREAAAACSGPGNAAVKPERLLVASWLAETVHGQEVFLT